MVEREKQAFWNMVNVCMELYRSPALSKEAIAIWWSKLDRFEFNQVSHAFDKWTDENRRQPTPADIIDLCKAQISRQHQFSIGRKFSQQEKQRNHERLQQVLQQLNIKRI